MNIRALLTTPNDWADLACHYGSYFTRTKLIPWIQAQGYELHDIQNELCTSEGFWPLVKEGWSYFKGFGHGNETQFAGYKNKILIEATSDMTPFKETVVHLLSCSTGAKLGPKFPLTYFGYKDVYYFMAARTTDPPDGLAEPYFDSDFEYDRARLSGYTHGKSIEMCKAKYTDWYNKADPYSRKWLLWDRDIAVGYGPLDHTHPGPPPPEIPCYWCPFKTADKPVLLKHICLTHCEAPAACKSWIPAWIRKATGCQYT